MSSCILYLASCIYNIHISVRAKVAYVNLSNFWSADYAQQETVCDRIFERNVCYNVVELSLFFISFRSYAWFILIKWSKNVCHFDYHRYIIISAFTTLKERTILKKNWQQITQELCLSTKYSVFWVVFFTLHSAYLFDLPMLMLFCFWPNSFLQLFLNMPHSWAQISLLLMTKNSHIKQNGKKHIFLDNVHFI